MSILSNLNPHFECVEEATRLRAEVAALKAAQFLNQQEVLSSKGREAAVRAELEKVKAELGKATFERNEAHERIRGLRDMADEYRRVRARLESLKAVAEEMAQSLELYGSPAPAYASWLEKEGGG